MVKQLVDALEENSDRWGIDYFHVDARFSKTIDGVGGGGLRKVGLAVAFGLRAIWLRVRHGIDTMYYVPAPPRRVPIYRDWIIMLMCRPFFKRLVFHWHAYGIGEWLEGDASRGWERKMTQWLLGRADLSIVLSDYNRKDAEVLRSKDIAVVPNGIPDPCDDFSGTVERRAAGASAEVLRVLYLGHCTREKGLFDAVEAVVMANAELERRGGGRVELTVAGEFLDPAEREEFDAAAGEAVRYVGFVGGEAKSSAFTEHDCLCFPTRYAAESFGLVLVEALAFGLVPVVSDWRTVGELARGAGLKPVPPGDPDAFAAALVEVACAPRCDAVEAQRLRDHFLANFSAGAHLEAMAGALRGESESAQGS